MHSFGQRNSRLQGGATVVMSGIMEYQEPRIKPGQTAYYRNSADDGIVGGVVERTRTDTEGTVIWFGSEEAGIPEAHIFHTFVAAAASEGYDPDASDIDPEQDQ
jgi:hypothetical protein